MFLNRGKLFTFNSLQEVLSYFPIVIAYIQANYPGHVNINEAYEDEARSLLDSLRNTIFHITTDKSSRRLIADTVRQ